MDFHLQPCIFRNASKHGLDESAVLRQQAAKKKTEAERLRGEVCILIIEFLVFRKPGT